MIKKFMGLLAVLAIGRASFFNRRDDDLVLANIAEGSHGTGRITKLTDAAISGRFRVVKFGSDAAHIAVAAAADAAPIGICTDEASAAELPVNVSLFGQTGSTLKCLLGGTVAAGDELAATAGGAVIKLPTATGTYYPFGRALQAGVSGDVIEFMSQPAIARAVA
jgi:hypothetical protein